MARISVSGEKDVVDAVRAARDSRRTMEIVGHGTKRGLGRPIECQDVLDLSALSGIVKYEPDEMVITARAGTPVAELEAALSEHNQRLGFEPADWGPLYGAPANSATIGGVLSASCDGSAAIRYGRCRDHLLSFRAVNGFGEAYKAGGKVVKNVTGFDLPKLMCGAMGTLSPLTEVTLRAFPKSKAEVVLAIRGVGLQVGLSLLRKIWSTALEATGLAYIPATTDVGECRSTAFVRLEGTRAVLQEKIAFLRWLVEPHHAHQVAEHEVFDKVCGVSLFNDASRDVWRVILPTATCEAFVERAGSNNQYVDWSGGLLWLETDRDVHALAQEFGARAVLNRGDGSVQPFAPEEPVRVELTKRVKAAFDPLRLFNPGRMWDGV